jgi:hypothetical protein
MIRQQTGARNRSTSEGVLGVLGFVSLKPGIKCSQHLGVIRTMVTNSRRGPGQQPQVITGEIANAITRRVALTISPAGQAQDENYCAEAARGRRKL